MKIPFKNVLKLKNYFSGCESALEKLILKTRLTFPRGHTIRPSTGWVRPIAIRSPDRVWWVRRSRSPQCRHSNVDKWRLQLVQWRDHSERGQLTRWRCLAPDFLRTRQIQRLVNYRFAAVHGLFVCHRWTEASAAAAAVAAVAIVEVLRSVVEMSIVGGCWGLVDNLGLVVVGISDAQDVDDEVGSWFFGWVGIHVRMPCLHWHLREWLLHVFGIVVMHHDFWRSFRFQTLDLNGLMQFIYLEWILRPRQPFVHANSAYKCIPWVYKIMSWRAFYSKFAKKDLLRNFLKTFRVNCQLFLSLLNS